MTINTNHHLTFGSRGSALARYQTNLVAERLQQAFNNLTVEITIFSTKGDRELNKPLPEIGGKGLFTAELEAALLNNGIDLAVHSLKDLPTEDTPGLTVGAILSRENPADVLVSRNNYTLETLPTGSTIGTSSLRRAAQLLVNRPDLNIISLRGNVDTRVKKALDAQGPYDAVVLAAAGLTRMNLTDHISQYLPFTAMLPAPGQGAIAVQCRANDQQTLNFLNSLNHYKTQQSILAERAFLEALGGGCSLPVGALATVVDETLTLETIVASVDGKQTIRLTHQGPSEQAVLIGRQVAEQALAQGAKTLLEGTNA